MAEKWMHRAQDVPDAQERDAIKTLDYAFDWTYTTNYMGHFSCPLNVEVAASTHELDMDLLQRHDPVHWFDDVILFEDELHDNGISSLSVKVRVMPTFWLILLRGWLRVDNVMVRVKDTRLFYAFGSASILRDFTSRELFFKDAARLHLHADNTLYTNPNIFSKRLPLVFSTKHSIAIPLVSS